MNLLFFNIAIAVGWLMVLIGVCLVNLPAGLIVAGALLLLITFAGARLAGLYARRTMDEG